MSSQLRFLINRKFWVSSRKFLVLISFLKWKFWTLKNSASVMDVDHYSFLGLPSGEEGAKLTEKEISKAYKQQALELHRDKRPDDPNAHENFQKL
ncbi:hypothetical protein SLE2022_118430 [Rubroshorea leprosula]